MSITSKLSEDQKHLTIFASGRFDFSCLQSFKSCYEKLSPKPENYTVDLAKAEYLDSSALGMLLALRDFADTDVSITNCNDDVKKILVVTKLDELFSVS